MISNVYTHVIFLNLLSVSSAGFWRRT